MTVLADTIVTVHLAFVLFVLIGQVAIMVGISWEYLAWCYGKFVATGRTLVSVRHLCRWGWVRNFWFRFLHLFQ